MVEEVLPGPVARWCRHTGGGQEVRVIEHQLRIRMGMQPVQFATPGAVLQRPGPEVGEVVAVAPDELVQAEKRPLCDQRDGIPGPPGHLHDILILEYIYGLAGSNSIPERLVHSGDF